MEQNLHELSGVTYDVIDHYITVKNLIQVMFVHLVSLRFEHEVE